VSASEQKPSFGEAVDLLVRTLKAFEERQQRTLIATVCDLLDLKSVGGREEQQAAAGGGTKPPPPPPPAGGVGDKQELPATDVRSLKEQKKPKSAREMAAIVAYYLKELAPQGERRETIKTEDLERYFKQARYDPPKEIDQLLAASKRAGYFDLVTRGEYKLTRVGYNLVAHRMPQA
jgi:hypothetical protein